MSSCSDSCYKYVHQTCHVVPYIYTHYDSNMIPGTVVQIHVNLVQRVQCIMYTMCNFCNVGFKVQRYQYKDVVNKPWVYAYCVDTEKLNRILVYMSHCTRCTEFTWNQIKVSGYTECRLAWFVNNPEVNIFMYKCVMVIQIMCEPYFRV